MDNESMRAAALSLAQTLADACASADAGDHYTAAHGLRSLASLLEVVEVRHVNLMRSQGMSWADIGALTGHSRNAARQRYLRLVA